MSAHIMFGVLLVLGIGFGFLNGINDSASLAAALVSSGAGGLRQALLVAAAAQLAGASFVGVAVAKAIGQGIVVSAGVTVSVVFAALLGSIFWNILTWYLGLPSSLSHALIGALVGAAWCRWGLAGIWLRGLTWLIGGLFLSPWLGFLASFLLMHLLQLVLQNATPAAGRYLHLGQWLLAPLLAAGHGSNDAQNVMAMVAMGLVALHLEPAFVVPFWLQIVAGLSLAAGTSIGGMRIMRTLGQHLYRIRASHGFASTAASAIAVLAASLLGAPVSNSQVISASIAGAGAAERFSKVRWQVAGNIVLAWLLTMPAAALMGTVFCWALTHLLGIA